MLSRQMAITLLLLVQGCAPSALRTADGACAAPEVDVAGWQEINLDGVSLAIPTELQSRSSERLREQVFRRNDQVVSIRFHPSSSDVYHPIGTGYTIGDPMAGSPNVVARCRAHTGDAEMSILSYVDREGYHAEALWPRARDGYDLSVSVSARDSRSFQRLRQIFWTVELSD